MVDTPGSAPIASSLGQARMPHSHFRPTDMPRRPPAAQIDTSSPAPTPATPAGRSREALLESSAESLVAEIENLRRALVSRASIDQAIGVLAERFRVAPDRSFDLLRLASQRSNVKLRDIAGYVVYSASNGGPLLSAEPGPDLGRPPLPSGQR